MGKDLYNLSKLKQNLKKWEDQRDQNTKAENEELEIAKKAIREKYAKQQEPIYKEIGEARKKIENNCKKIQLFSTFDSKIIGEILEQLVTIFEGEEYCYQETTFQTTKIEHCVFDRVESKVDKEIRIIIKADCKREKYDNRFSGLYRFVSDGNVIMLCEDEYRLEPDISFNHSNIRNTDIESNVKYGKFDYVKEFMNGVIDFRIANKMVNINKSDLYKLLGEFLAERKDFIESNYQLRQQEKQEAFKQQLEQSQNQYSPQLKKVMTQTN